jgi:alanine dehydrogenase
VIKLTTPGFQVVIEKDAGMGSHFSDPDYEAAGAKVVDDVWKSDIVLKVRVCTEYRLGYRYY